MNTAPQNNSEPRKLARITAEQEALLRAFERLKKLGFGELTLYVQGGNIVRYEAKKSQSMTVKKPNTESIREVIEDLGDLEDMEGVIAI